MAKLNYTYTFIFIILFIVISFITFQAFQAFKKYEGFSNNNIIDYGKYGKVKTNIIEVADNVYKTPFFPKKLCKKLIDSYEEFLNERQLLHNDSFIKKNDLDHLDSNDLKYEPGMTAKLNKIPKIYNYFNHYVKKYLFPIVNKKYPYFDGRKISPPYILRYESDKFYESKMDIHIDNEQVPIIIYLNDDFEGGGTYFPLLKKTINGNTGDLIFYPGGVTHPHGGKKITKGKRYILLFSIIDPEI